MEKRIFSSFNMYPIYKQKILVTPEKLPEIIHVTQLKTFIYNIEYMGLLF